jgi:hypothetical protein
MAPLISIGAQSLLAGSGFSPPFHSNRSMAESVGAVLSDECRDTERC